MLGEKYQGMKIKQNYWGLGSGSEICKIRSRCKVSGQVLGYLTVLGYRRYVLGAYISRKEC